MIIYARIISLLAIASVVVKGEGDHESCACAAKEEGFAIDCSNQGQMTAALAALSANDCDVDCSAEVCHRNYLIIQSHHDYCLESELPPTIEDALHVYEDFCDECEIAKKFDPSLDQCPAASCTDDSGNDAWTALVGNGCDTDCSSSVCGKNFRMLKVVHDTCPEDTLNTAAEANFHDLEEACNDIHGCNLSNSSDPSALVCEDASGASSSQLHAVGCVVAALAADYVASFF